MDSDVSDVKTIRRSVFTIGVPQSKEYGAGGYAARYGRLCDGDRMPASGGYHRLSPDGEGRRAVQDGERLRVSAAPQRKLGGPKTTEPPVVIRGGAPNIRAPCVL